MLKLYKNNKIKLITTHLQTESIFLYNFNKICPNLNKSEIQIILIISEKLNKNIQIWIYVPD